MCAFVLRRKIRNRGVVAKVISEEVRSTRPIEVREGN